MSPFEIAASEARPDPARQPGTERQVDLERQAAGITRGGYAGRKRGVRKLRRDHPVGD